MNYNMKTCTKCENNLPLTKEYFQRRPESKSGWRGTCKVCMGGKYGVTQRGSKIVKCEHCRNEFKIERNMKRRFCSRDCWMECETKNSAKRTGETVKCKNCRKEYYKNTSDIRKACSVKCTNEIRFREFINDVEKKNNIPSLRSYFEKEYAENKKTYRELSLVLGINQRTISKLLNFYDIQIIHSNRTFSHGENRVKEWLESKDLDYQQQFFFEDCKRMNPLPFDFAVFINGKLDLLIEYDGQQHFSPVEVFGGAEAHKKVKENDAIKNSYCESKGIQLVRIPYWELDDIEGYLSSNFNKIYKPLQLSIL